MFYTSNQAIINDIRLGFSNCLSYNMEDAEEYGCAERLEKFFNAQLKAQVLVVEQAFKPKSKMRQFRTIAPCAILIFLQRFLP